MGGIPPAKGQRRRIKRRWVWVVGVLALALFSGSIFAGTVLYKVVAGIQTNRKDNDHADDQLPVRREPLGPDEPLHILLLGIDEGLVEGGGRIAEGARRSDTALLLTVDKLTDHLGLLWVPRDTYVQVPQAAIDELTALRGRNTVRQNPTKMSHVHAYGGPMLAMASVSELLHVPVKRFVRFDFKGFERIIDLLGGVEIDVERRLQYEDPYQDLYIDIAAGRQTMNGKTALHYMRYRGDEGDTQRIPRQQRFIGALVDQALRLNFLVRLPDLINEVAASITTDLSSGELLSLARLAAAQAGGFAGEQMITGMLPGRPTYINSVSYWLPDEGALSQELERVVWGVDYEQNATVRVAVHNDQGGSFGRALEELGYQVVSGAADVQPVTRTQVFDHRRRGDLPVRLLARHVARLIPTAEFYRQNGDDEAVDMTVVVGRDYEPRDKSSGVVLPDVEGGRNG